MGYQESFIFTNKKNVEKNNRDIATIIELFKKHDVRVADDELGSCVAKLTFEKNLDFFKKGMEVLWIVGERQCQREPWRLFDIYEEDFEEENVIREKMKKFTNSEAKLINSIEIIFLDNIDYLMQDISPAIKTGNTEYVTYQALDLLPERPIYMDKMEELAKKIRPSEEKIDDDFNGVIFGLDDYESYNQKLKEVCAALNLPLKIEVEHLENLNVPQYSYWINGVLLATYHETPHLEKKGSWYIKCSAQNLRSIANAINMENLSA